MSAKAGIISTLKDTYDGSAWHGPSLMQVCSKIPAAKANTRIGPGHSIIEIVLHMVAWRNFVIHKLNGDDSYDVTEEINFPQSNNWTAALEELDKNQKELLQAIAQFDEQKLIDLVPGRNYSFYKLLHGIVHHDTYHQGQIVMITKQF